MLPQAVEVTPGRAIGWPDPWWTRSRCIVSGSAIARRTGHPSVVNATAKEPPASLLLKDDVAERSPHGLHDIDHDPVRDRLAERVFAGKKVEVDRGEPVAEHHAVVIEIAMPAASAARTGLGRPQEKIRATMMWSDGRYGRRPRLRAHRMAAMPERRRALVGAAPTIARKRPRTSQRTVQKCSTKLGQPWRRALEREVEPAPARSKANDPYRPQFHLSRWSKIGRSPRTLDTSRRPTSSQRAHADHRVLKRLDSDFKARGGLIQRYNDRDALASEGCPQSLDAGGSFQIALSRMSVPLGTGSSVMGTHESSMSQRSWRCSRRR